MAIVSDGLGYAVIWMQASGASVDLHASIYAAGSWSAPEVLARSTQLILNPFEGHPLSVRNVATSEIRETVKELSQIDGAFVISGDGIIEAAGRYITIDTSGVGIAKGLGTRHSSIAGITLATKAIGIVVSQSGGKISIFRDGRMLQEIG